ncbi:hypothetical protein [Propionicimonas sp.]
MTHDSAPELLALHGVRILGGPSADAIAQRFGLDLATLGIPRGTDG